MPYKLRSLSTQHMEPSLLQSEVQLLATLVLGHVMETQTRILTASQFVHFARDFVAIS